MAELEAIPYEPLFPIEKKLIVWCLVLGVVLLGLLLWASATGGPRGRAGDKGTSMNIVVFVLRYCFLARRIKHRPSVP